MRIILVRMVLLLSSFAIAPISASDSNDPLADWQWNKRLLVSCMLEEVQFHPEQTAPVYKSIDWSGFEERNIHLVEIRKNTIHTVQYIPIKGEERVKVLIYGDKSEGVVEEMYILNGLTRKLHADDKNNLRGLASCQRDDEFILIGKDETVKRVWQNVAPMDELFAIIDAMPMRQREMREQKEQ